MHRRELLGAATPSNGDVFVADGHFGQQATATPATALRSVKFTRDNKFIKAFGKWGSAPGELKTPHAMAIDARGRLMVADRPASCRQPARTRLIPEHPNHGPRTNNRAAPADPID
jgi:hypothetical protein